MHNRFCFILLIPALLLQIAAAPLLADEPPVDENTVLTGISSKAGGPATTPLEKEVERIEKAEKADDFSTLLEASESALILSPEHAKPRFANRLATAAWWLAHEATGRGDWKSAEQLFGRIAELSLSYPHIAKTWSQEGMDIRTHLELVRRMATQKPVKPEYTHKLLLVFVREVSVDQTGLANNRILGNSVLSDRQKAYTLRTFNALKGYLEALSQGRFSLSYSFVEYPGTITRFRLTPDTTYKRFTEVRAPDSDYSNPPIWYSLRDRFAETDTIAYIWGGGDGLSNYANGGSMSQPIIPWTLRTPTRGYMQIPAMRLIGRYGPVLTLHEFFHTVETMADIKPMHGFHADKRINFPEWTGAGQLDYYRWHFENTIPARLASAKNFKPEAGWGNLNFAARYPTQAPPLDLLDSLAERATKIPATDRQKAQALLYQAEKLVKEKKDDDALPMLEEAARLHPFHPGILFELGRLHERAKRYDLALTPYSDRAAFFPDFKGLQRLGNIQRQLKQDQASALSFHHAANLARSAGDRLRALLNSGDASNRAGDYLKAVEQYAIVTKETSKALHSQLHGESLYKSGLIMADRLGQSAEGVKLLELAMESGYDSTRVSKAIARISKRKQ